MRCRKCGYEWKIRTLFPKSCPRCKSYNYKDERGLKKDAENNRSIRKS